MIPLVDEHRHLDPGTRARTVLATADCVHVCFGDDAARRSTGFLACGSEIFLVRPRPTRPGQQRASAVCRSPVRGLGGLQLIGRCDTPLTAPELRALVPFLGEPGDQPADQEPDTEVVPLLLDEVRLLVPATRAQRAYAVAVAVDRFQAAVPDGWVAATESLGRHLEECHQAELGALVVRHLGHRPEAVVVRSVDRESLRVVGLGEGGVTDVTVAYGRPLRRVTEVADWLRQTVRS